MDAEYDMDLLRLMKGTTFLWILSGNGSGRESGSVLSKDVIIPKDTSRSPFIPSCLRDHTLGYWASQALGPSSKARDCIGLYT